MKIKFVAMAFSSLFVAGLCANTWAADSSTVDCSTAADTISHLEHEKKSTHERKMKGVMAVMPIGIAINTTEDIASSGSHEKMDVDDYNKKIDERIAEIKSACNID